MQYEFDHVTCNAVKPSTILVLDESGEVSDITTDAKDKKYTYFQVEAISTAKPGKHGSAKYIFKGRNLKTGAKVEKSFVSGTKVAVVSIKKVQAKLIDINSLEATIMTDEQTGDIVQIPKQEFTKEDFEMLQTLFQKNKDNQDGISFAYKWAPGFLSIESVDKDVVGKDMFPKLSRKV